VVLLQFPCEIYASYEAAVAASTRNSAALRLLKVESGINGLLPTSWVPSIYSVSLLIRLRYALEEVTDFCVRPLCARSSRPAAKRKEIKANARGFRSFRNYRTRILFFCGKLTFFTA